MEEWKPEGQLGSYYNIPGMSGWQDVWQEYRGQEVQVLSIFWRQKWEICWGIWMRMVRKSKGTRMTLNLWAWALRPWEDFPESGLHDTPESCSLDSKVITTPSCYCLLTFCNLFKIARLFKLWTIYILLITISLRPATVPCRHSKPCIEWMTVFLMFAVYN